MTEVTFRQIETGREAYFDLLEIADPNPVHIKRYLEKFCRGSEVTAV